MKSTWGKWGSLLVGLLGAALCAFPQNYTISARPGAINYVEGTAYLNEHPLYTSVHTQPFLNAGDTLSTENGKVEVLLTPGVFLRLGADSLLRAKIIALTDIDLQLERGEAMVEVDELLEDNSIRIVDQDAAISLLKPGLYKFTAGQSASATTITGKAEVTLGAKKVKLGGNREVLLETGLPERKFDKKKEDDLYAWSTVRAEYDAAASLQSARSMSTDNFGSAGYGGGAGYGPWSIGGLSNPGWYWNGIFDSWAWIPGGDLAYFSPFGYGFFAPGVVQYAPICYVRRNWGGAWHGQMGNAPVAVNPDHPPALGAAPASPWASNLARAQVSRSFAANGFQTPMGGAISSSGNGFSAGSSGGTHWSAANGAGVSHGVGAWSGGGGGHSSAASFGGGSFGGGHTAGASGGGGGHH